MRIVKSSLFLILSVSLYLSISLSHIYAAGEFSPAYDVTYEVKETGQTTVTQTIHLTNLTTNYYASEYTLILGTEKINQVEAWDSQGPLKTDLKKGTDLTKIHVVFNEKVVGVGKTLNWGLRFESQEIAQKLGRIWEINIPRVSAEEQAAAYNVTLIVPPVFGQPSYIWPKPKKPYSWTIEDGSRKGITIGFGDWQGFKFDLSYHLENPQMIPETIDIAFPPDTSYQKIILNKIEPAPIDITIDEDGNWLAKYFLLPGQKQDIKVSGLAQVFLQPRTDYPVEDIDKIRQKYLAPQKYWEADDPEISKVAKELKTPEAIYNYVLSTLTYDYQRASGQSSRLGAKQILLTPNKAICMEFTDLFIAISRAAGIPAREVDGYAYTSNSRLKPLSLVADVLHAWPEYWDEQRQIWIQVDPTWEKTSQINYFSRFDFNHLAFVKRGVDSQKPYPAGSYKDKKGGKDVLVDFYEGQLDFSSLEAAKLELSFPKIIITGLPVSGQIRIINKSDMAIYNLRLNLASSLLKVSFKEVSLTALPPNGERTLEVKFENSNLLLMGKNTLTVYAGSQKKQVTSQIVPLPLMVFLFLTGLLFLIIFLKFLTQKIWRRFS